MISVSSPSSSTRNSFPRRLTPSMRLPSRTENGGSNVFSAFTPGVSADSIVLPDNRLRQPAGGDLNLG